MEVREFKEPGILYLVSTPIGNYADLTIRALRILTESDYIICENRKESSKLLRFFEIRKELVELNEHNEAEESESIIRDIISGKNLSLISDCGTPAFEDPGSLLIQRCNELSIRIDFIPGANSLMTGIVLCGFDISRFYYFGFLSPKTEIRRKEIKKFKSLDRAFAFMETPYRLKTVLNDLNYILPDRRIFVGFDLTMESEKHFRGTAPEILREIEINYGGNLKGEFVIVVEKPLKSEHKNLNQHTGDIEYKNQDTENF
jgi:16S rRNA (cytidine1402-2'-O)-methyltransferase